MNCSSVPRTEGSKTSSQVVCRSTQEVGTPSFLASHQIRHNQCGACHVLSSWPLLIFREDEIKWLVATAWPEAQRLLSVYNGHRFPKQPNLNHVNLGDDSSSCSLPRTKGTRVHTSSACSNTSRKQSVCISPYFLHRHVCI